MITIHKQMINKLEVYYAQSLHPSVLQSFNNSVMSQDVYAKLFHAGRSMRFPALMTSGSLLAYSLSGK